MARKAETGDTVDLLYECRDDDGEIIEQTPAGEHLSVVIGDGCLLPPLEDMLIGLSEGDVRDLSLEPEEAFGPYRPELVGFIENDALPEGLEVEHGAMLEISGEDEDEPMPAEITSVEEDGVVVDGNHPLAGRRLHFKLTLLCIE